MTGGAGVYSMRRKCRQGTYKLSDACFLHDEFKIHHATGTVKHSRLSSFNQTNK